MTTDRDITPIVRVWLEDRGRELGDPHVGFDRFLALVEHTPQRRPGWRRLWSSTSRPVTILHPRTVRAGTLLAAVTMAALGVGSLFLAAGPGPSPVSPSPSADASPTPMVVQPVDWITVEGDPPFRGTGHSGSDYLTDVAIAPSGQAVIVGAARSQGLAWSRASGGDWQRSTLPADGGARPRRVLATKEGFVSIGRNLGEATVGFIWTSEDRIDWSGTRVEGAEFDDLGSVDDTVAVLGTLRGAPTVWTSRSGGPWEAATIAEGSNGFSPDQLAISADGVYLVRDSRTGLAQRSEDGRRFTSVDLPDGPQTGDAGISGTALVHLADGFALVGGSGDSTDVRTMNTWRSSDGRTWRRGDAAPGLAIGHQLGVQRPAAVMVGARADLDSAAPSTYLSFLQADGTWCPVSPPGRPDEFSPDAMAWNDEGTLIITGPYMPGAPVAWYATGVGCGR